MREKAMTRATIFPLLVVAHALFLLLAGCGREQSSQTTTPPEGAGEASTPYVAKPSVTTELQYVLAEAFDSGLSKLHGIAVDANDRVYLAGAEGVRVLDRRRKPVRIWRTSEPARCIALDGEGNVYVGLRTKVEKYTADGKRIASWGKAGKGRGEFAVITAIVVSDTNVFVADAGNRCIHRFDITGDFIDEIGKRDRDVGFVGLICPSPYLDCDMDASGVLYVTDPGRLRVEKYRLDGKLLGYWGEPGIRPEQFCGCCNPTNLVLMPNGRLATAEKGIPRVKVYDRDGKMLAFISSKFFSRNAAGMDLALDSFGRIYIIDPGDGKVRVFRQVTREAR